MCAICQIFTGTPDIGEKFLYAGYIDPGTGFVFSSAVPFVLGIIATFFGSTIFFLRKKIWPFIKKYIRILLVLFSIVVIGTIIFAINNNMKNTAVNKVVIIGLDGLDPKIIEQGFKKNLLPNLKRLKDVGSYTTLQTTVPPQSPVAWASFLTGNWPSKHKVYDFIERKPLDYSLDLGFSNPQKNPIQSTAFWEITAKNNIPTTVLFLPDTFPAPQFKGKMIAGMGVPDVLGTIGTFTLFSTKDYSLDPKWRGRLMRISNEKEINTVIEGPKFTLIKEKKITSIPLVIKKNNKSLIFKFQNKTISVPEGQFSDWIRLEFSIDFFTKIHGIAKLYVKQIEPEIEVYLSPINFDPYNPIYPISSPKGYAKELVKDYGLYSTLGMPHDTWALEEGIFSEETFFKNADDLLDERKKIILGELKKFQNGLFFGYFGITDTIQHMYWRFLNDPSSKYQNTILDYYQKVDTIVGEVMKSLKEKDSLIIMSDHGFDEYDYELNVNTWLKDNGYLTLKDNKELGKELLSDIDWDKTKAYSIGYNGIFFNIKGREGKGIVQKESLNQLENELTSKLLQLNNSFTGKPIFKKLYTRKELSIPENDISSPDIFLGFYKGTRSSWDTAVGGAPKNLLVKRQSKWSGDHLFDPSEIPGVLFINKKIYKQPRIIDIIPTTLKILNISQNEAMDGISLLDK